MLAAVVIAGVAYYVTRGAERTAVSVVAVHYFPPQHRVDEFYVNSHYFSHSNFEGTADTGMCCVWLPARWHPGLVVDVSWAVSDWTLSPIENKENFDPKKIRVVGIYRAKVPVERYQSPSDLFVHFFEGGKVRVAPGIPELGDAYRSRPSILSAARVATQGKKVSEPFTAEDMSVIDKDVRADRKRYGDWR